MERRTFPTPVGEIWLHGEAEAFDGDAPIVLAIKGAFAEERGPYDLLQARLPETAVMVAELPGHTCPAFDFPSIGTFGYAFGHVARGFTRPVTVMGESAGGLVALAMDADVRRLALDPPLHTAKLWPAFPFYRRAYAELPRFRSFLTNVFGVTAEGIVDRDYTATFVRPAHVMVGDVPLWPQRPFVQIPSVLDDEDRAVLTGRPELRVTTVKGAGHLIYHDAPDVVIAAVRALMNDQRVVGGHGVDSPAP